MFHIISRKKDAILHLFLCIVVRSCLCTLASSDACEDELYFPVELLQTGMELGSGRQSLAAIDYAVRSTAGITSIKHNSTTFTLGLHTSLSWLPKSNLVDLSLLTRTIIAAFTLVAWWSICRESFLLQASKIATKSRDPLWDIAKFCFLVCVLHYHALFNFSVTVEWYTGFQMPGFFMISGMLHQGKDAFDRGSLMRVLRDNVLNNCFYIIILIVAGARSYANSELSLWFLWALALYRCLLFPLVKGLQSCLGSTLGILVSFFGIGCVLSIGLANMFPSPFPTPPAWAKPCIDVLALVFFMNAGEANYIFQYAAFYVLGLAMNKGSLREAISGAISVFVALCFLIVGPAFVQSISIYSSSSFPYSVMMNVWNALGALAFMACCAPVADAGNAFLQVLGRMVGACGSRTLYGYYLHMLLRFTFPYLWMQITTMTGYGYGVDVVFQTMLLAAFCSPFAEQCFGWLVSPQWVINHAHNTLMWVFSGGSCNSQGNKEQQRSDSHQ